MAVSFQSLCAVCHNVDVCNPAYHWQCKASNLVWHALFDHSTVSRVVIVLAL